VSDVDRSAGAFRDAGGRIIRDPVDARKDLRVAVVSDPQGAPLGLASRGPLVEQVGVPALHRWLWMDYVARDQARALDFYGSAVSFRNEVHETRGTFTYYLLSSDRPRAGLFLSPWPRETAAWLPYVRVADPAATAARVTELGGTVVVAPQPQVRNGSLAIVLDPSGAPSLSSVIPSNPEPLHDPTATMAGVHPDRLCLGVHRGMRRRRHRHEPAHVWRALGRPIRHRRDRRRARLPVNLDGARGYQGWSVSDRPP
jgi:predicted enzyme related to lactoylglutathione lyase